MTNFNGTAHRELQAKLLAERSAWIPVPPQKLADPNKNRRRGAIKRTKRRTIL